MSLTFSILQARSRWILYGRSLLYLFIYARVLRRDEWRHLIDQKENAAFWVSCPTSTWHAFAELVAYFLDRFCMYWLLIGINHWVIVERERHDVCSNDIWNETSHDTEKYKYKQESHSLSSFLLSVISIFWMSMHS